MDILVLCLFAFVAGLVDAVAGGGGLIQVPALFAVFPSVPPSMLLGTNKISSIAGTVIAALRYGWSVPIRWKTLLPGGLFAGGGALAGAKTVTLIDPGLLRPIAVAMLILVAIYTVLHQKFGSAAGNGAMAEFERSGIAAFGALVGFYDGFFGPGTGSFLMFGLIRLFGYDFLAAAAATKILNLATNVSALALFVATGNVLFEIGLPMAICNVAGGFLGAHLAVRRGSQFIRVVFLLVISGLIGKLAVDLLF